MKKIKSIMRNIVFTLMFCIVLLLLGCSEHNKSSTNFKAEMEILEDYDDTDPFIDERLFYVTDNAESLKLDVSFQIESESSVLEILDNETDEVLWRAELQENENDKVIVPLKSLKKDKEYVIKFTGTKIEYVKIIISSNNKLIKERVKPEAKKKLVSIMS